MLEKRKLNKKQRKLPSENSTEDVVIHNARNFSNARVGLRRKIVDSIENNFFRNSGRFVTDVNDVENCFGIRPSHA